MKNPLTAMTTGLAMVWQANAPRIKLLVFFLVLTSQIAFSQTVYVTRTGEKYHNDACRYLSKSKIETTLQDAKENGYTACSVCKPSSTVRSSTVTPNPQKVSSAPPPVRKATSTQCTGITKANKRCSRMTTSANGRCYQH